MSKQHEAVTTQTVQPEAHLLQLAFGALFTQALNAAAKLRLADLLAEGPRSVAELAAATRTHERSLYRLMRSLASVGVFTEVEPKVFALTPVGEKLRAGVPGSMRNCAIFMGEEWHWRAWGHLLHSVRTGETAWQHVHGIPIFEFFEANPDAAAVFNDTMTDMSTGVAPAIVEAYDFSGFHVLADIAGGHGYLLAQILKANPTVSGILFDVASVIEGAGGMLEREGVAARVEKVAGDFFESVPAADGYVMKHIIHDWDDERAIKILKNIRAAMRPGAKVLVVEAVVPQGDAPHYSKLLDLEMLTLPGGVERTADEYAESFRQAGLRLTRILPTRSPFSIVEAVAA
jgi:hypothetical protein